MILFFLSLDIYIEIYLFHPMVKQNIIIYFQ